jgi:hypothetical protein
MTRYWFRTKLQAQLASEELNDIARTLDSSPILIKCISGAQVRKRTVAILSGECAEYVQELPAVATAPWPQGETTQYSMDHLRRYCTLWSTVHTWLQRHDGRERISEFSDAILSTVFVSFWDATERPPLRTFPTVWWGEGKSPQSEFLTQRGAHHRVWVFLCEGFTATFHQKSPQRHNGRWEFFQFFFYPVTMEKHSSVRLAHGFHPHRN